MSKVIFINIQKVMNLFSILTDLLLAFPLPLVGIVADYCYPQQLKSTPAGTGITVLGRSDDTITYKQDGNIVYRNLKFMDSESDTQCKSYTHFDAINHTMLIAIRHTNLSNSISTTMIRTYEARHSLPVAELGVSDLRSLLLYKATPLILMNNCIYLASLRSDYARVMINNARAMCIHQHYAIVLTDIAIQWLDIDDKLQEYKSIMLVDSGTSIAYHDDLYYIARDSSLLILDGDGKLVHNISVPGKLQQLLIIENNLWVLVNDELFTASV